jgi:hypothetical protein
LERTVLIVAATVASLSDAFPSQVGVQPEPARMNASMNDFWPVAAITGPRSGGALSSGITYGAAPYQLLGSVAACAEPVTARTAPPAVRTAPAIAPMRAVCRTGILPFCKQT